MKTNSARGKDFARMCDLCSHEVDLNERLYPIKIDQSTVMACVWCIEELEKNNA